MGNLSASVLARPPSERAYYEEIADQLQGLEIRVGDRLAGTDATSIAEFIVVNELGLTPKRLGARGQADGDNLARQWHALSPAFHGLWPPTRRRIRVAGNSELSHELEDKQSVLRVKLHLATDT